jgi:hypothetical protein
MKLFWLIKMGLVAYQDGSLARHHFDLHRFTADKRLSLGHRRG